MKKLIVALLVIISVMVISCSNAEISNIDQKEDDNNSYVYTKEEYDQIMKERDQYKSDLDNLQNEYSQYREKMKDYENLSEAEADARLIEANRIKEEEEKAKQEAAEEEKRLKEEKEKIGYDTGITYEQLARTPDDYVFEKVKFSGKVVQTIESEDEVDMRFAIDGDSDKIIYVVYQPTAASSRILEKDELVIYGISWNLYSYTSTLGATITVPLVYADKVELKDGVNVVSSTGENVVISAKDYIAQHSDEITKELKVTEYEYSSLGVYFYDCFEIENPTEYDLNLNIDVKFYDKNNNLVGFASDSKSCFERGTTVFIKCQNDEEYDHSEYTITVSPALDWYSPATSKISYEVSETSSKLIISAYNNSDKEIDASADVLFFNSKGELVDTNRVIYFYIDAGATEIKESRKYKDVKSYKVIFYATE